MMSHFPIFVDLQTRAPLIIGDADELALKLRLLQKAAPLVEVIPFSADGWHRAFVNDPSVKIQRPLGARAETPGGNSKFARDRVMSEIKGRPLVILDIGDNAINCELVAIARDHGVPVNVPDAPELCSFYLASIVDRAPLIIAISTSGIAPVLGQVIRAKLESMLVPHYGKLAGFLHGLRARLKGHSPARRRAVQRQIVTGLAAQKFLAGDSQGAGQIADQLLAGAASAQSTGSVTLVGYGSGVLDLLSLAAAEAIRGADAVFHDRGTPDEILEIVRREAPVVLLDNDLGSVEIAARLATEAAKGTQIVWLGAGDIYHHQALLGRLQAEAVNTSFLPSAAVLNTKSVPAIPEPSRAGNTLPPPSVALPPTVGWRDRPITDGSL